MTKLIFKKGQIVKVEALRNNPQLGERKRVEDCVFLRQSAKSVWVDFPCFGEMKFNKETLERASYDPYSGYGSMHYSIISVN